MYPMKGCWVSESQIKGDSAMRLDDNPMVLRPQEPRALAIATKQPAEKRSFALAVHSFPFLSWKNPALGLPETYFLRIVLMGETVKQTFHYYIQLTSKDLRGDTYGYGPVLPPEDMR
jgi:hypothetical protein